MLLTTSPVPTASIAELSLLRTTRNESGYRGVYVKRKAHSGVLWYCAKAKIGRRLIHLAGSTSPDPRVPASHVVQWYRRTFGPDWPAALRRRKLNGWKVRFSGELGGFHCAIWVRGRRTEVMPVDAEGRILDADLPAVFHSREAARAGLIRFAHALLGPDWRSQLWRV